MSLIPYSFLIFMYICQHIDKQYEGNQTNLSVLATHACHGDERTAQRGVQ